jgi:predicted nucleotidyltransferase
MKVIKKPNSIAEDLVADYRQVFCDNLIAVIMYGSALTSGYRPGKSDINIVVVLDDDAIAEIGKSVSMFRKWSKCRVTVPFFMSRKFIASALDAYPVEFLDIRSNYRVLFGEDVFAAISIDNNYLRLQCERELRGLAIHLRSAYVAAGGRNKVLAELLTVSVKKLLPVFKALLTLRDLPVPAHRGEIVAAVEHEFVPDSTILLEVYNAVYCISLKRSYTDLYNSYTEGIDALINVIDAQFNEGMNV